MGDKDPPDKGGIPTIVVDESDPVIGLPSSLPQAKDASQITGMDLDTDKNSRKRLAVDIPTQAKKVTSPGDSSQNVYVSPGYTENDPALKYTHVDKGPFVVHICRKEPDPSAGLTLQALRLAQLLHKNKVQGVVEGSIKSMGRNKVSVSFKSAQVANDFCQSDLLNRNKLVADIPKYLLSRTGVVQDIPTDWTLEEVVEGIEYPVGFSHVQIIKARRMSRKIRREGQPPEWVPSKTVVLTFHSQILPEKIYLFNMAMPVKVYELPTIQCRSCCKFGHISAKCRSKPCCYSCAQPHTGDTCQVSDDKISCVLCTGPHKATDPKCPEHSRQKSIKIVMADENIGYLEASQRFRSVRTTYAEMSQKLFAPVPRVTEAPTIYSSPIPNYTEEPTTSSQISYKKTVYKEQKPHHLLSKSYDVRAHKQIINEPKSCLPNGSALANNPMINTPNDTFMEHLVALVVNFVHKYSEALPNNVITQLQTIIPYIPNNGPQSPAVELTEH
jgi:hypothetical protein